MLCMPLEMLRPLQKKIMEVCNSEEIYEQLSQQIHIESKIIDQKFISVHKSIKFFGLSIIFVIVALAFYLITA